MATNGFDKRPQDINRKGRPLKKWTWSDIFIKLVNELGDDKQKIKYAMGRKMIKKVLKDGDVAAFKEITNRIDGLPIQTIDTNLNFKMETLKQIQEDTKKILDE